MAKYEEKFIVINNKHINELPIQEKEEFIQALVKIRKLIPKNKYLVCNQDEPYANNVLNIILTGEDAKKALSNSDCAKCEHDYQRGEYVWECTKCGHQL